MPGQNKCWRIIASVRSSPRWRRYLWYQCTTYFWIFCGITILSWFVTSLIGFRPPREDYFRILRLVVWLVYRRGGSRTWRRKAEPRREHPQGSSGTPASSRVEKGGITEGVRGGRNRLVAQGCRGREGPEDQVDGGKTASARRAVEAGGSGRLSRWTCDPRPEEKGENRVLKERYSSV